MFRGLPGSDTVLKAATVDHVNGMPTWNDHGSSLALGRLLAWRGVFAHEMLIEPGNRAPDGVDLVLTFHEAVTFIRVIVNIHGASFLLKDIDDLLRLLLRHARVIIALQH